MKTEDDQWLKNIRDVLRKTALGDVWLNARAWDKASLKGLISNRLRDIAIQELDCSQYTTTNEAKCQIVNSCYCELYIQRKYLNIIKSLDMRSIVTKFRIDMNFTANCRYFYLIS